MKRFWILIYLAALCVFSMSADTGLSAEDEMRLRNAVMLVDQGMADAALVDFDDLCKKLPDNYLVRYEKLYALYKLGRYGDIVKESKKLLGMKDVGAQAFAMVGNAYDIVGDRDKARKVYKQGLKKFPDFGGLYLELGNIAMSDGNIQESFDYHNMGIEADPNFASNYYRASLVCFMTDNRQPWGLAYAEAEMLLAPNNQERLRDMGSSYRDCLMNRIKVENAGDSVAVAVNFSENTHTAVYESTGEVRIAYEGIFQACMNIAAKRVFRSAEGFTGTIAQMAALRREFVDVYYDVAGNLYGDAMWIYPYQKKVMDAGHWEAYNYFLFSEALPEEFDLWLDGNREKYEAFVNWFNSDPFRLDASRSVCILSLYRDFPRMDMMASLMLFAKFEAGAIEAASSDGAD